MSDPFLNLKDNQIEIIVLSYLIKHPTFLDEFFEKLNDKIFHNPEHKKILHVLNEFSKNYYNGYFILIYLEHFLFSLNFTVNTLNWRTCSCTLICKFPSSFFVRE